MKKLWAPWRSRYIRNLDRTSSRCVFCVKAKQRKDAKNLIIRRGKHCFAVLNLYPYNNGHAMVVPYRHLTDLARLTQEEVLEIHQFICRVQQKTKKKMRAAGFNIGVNLGKDSGAGFKHIHFHVVPRWRGDTNFMPILTDTKIVSESLDAVYQLLKQ